MGGRRKIIETAEKLEQLEEEGRKEKRKERKAIFVSRIAEAYGSMDGLQQNFTPAESFQ